MTATKVTTGWTMQGNGADVAVGEPDQTAVAELPVGTSTACGKCLLDLADINQPDEMVC
jgi:hypothetical protein